MKIDKSPRYNRTVKKILKSHTLSRDKIEECEKLFEDDYKHYSLRYHQIRCKKDKNRYSITVPSTQYRILLSNFGDKVILVALLNHKDYDQNNKDC